MFKGFCMDFLSCETCSAHCRFLRIPSSTLPCLLCNRKYIVFHVKHANDPARLDSRDLNFILKRIHNKLFVTLFLGSLV